jgi:hypothetical protein
MLGWPTVADIAERLGFPDAAHSVRENPRAYGRGVFKGFRKAGR